MPNAARRFAIALGVALAALVVARPYLAAQVPPKPASALLPDRLSDADFWTLEEDISEPGGYFRIADNFTSNENEIGGLVTRLRATGMHGGVYLGVGPEQNLTYIAAIRPAMAFVVDIRRQAVMQHLMFKAAFELARDRADFISMLFSKPRPDGIVASTPIQEIWNRFTGVATDLDLAKKNHARIVDLLTATHHFALTKDEASQLDYVIESFVQFGPAITTSGGPGRGRGGNALSFADLTGWSVDASGAAQSFLASEADYQTVKALEERNLLVPVSGDFGGPKALRAIGAYLHQHGATVTAFYLSNVEQYLFQDGKQMAFYDNVAALPLNDTSVFIRPYALRGPYNGNALCPMIRFLGAVHAGRVVSNNDALACPQ
jgi:hypothetical protein